MSATEAAQRILNHYTTTAGTVARRAEPWLIATVRERLEAFTEEAINQAVTTALRDLPKADRHRLRLGEILKIDTLRGYCAAKGLRPGTAPQSDNALRMYLAVPFEEKNKAKNAGAKWDAHARRWYAPSHDAPTLKKLERWIEPTHREAKPQPIQNEPLRELAGGTIELAGGTIKPLSRAIEEMRKRLRPDFKKNRAGRLSLPLPPPSEGVEEERPE